MAAYGGCSETNRAPTPAELSCAGPKASCSPANFFVGDPDLKQIVAHTVQVGLRGKLSNSKTTSLSCDFSQFDDDILFVNSPGQGRAFFEDVGRTRRRGADATLRLVTQRWSVTLACSYTKASLRTGFTNASGNNPMADQNGDIQVRSGDRLPGLPANLLKATAQFMLTRNWGVGVTGIVASKSYLYGDEASLTQRLPAYCMLNLESRYQITPALQVYENVDDLTDRRYHTYGTFSPTGSVVLAQAPNATDPRSYSPAAPIKGFGGLRISF